MDFYSDCKDNEEAKKLYRKLCKCFHPDRGGDIELLMCAIHQYNDFNVDQHKPKPDPVKKDDDFAFSSFDDARYMQIQTLRNKLFKFESEMKALRHLIDMQTKALEIQKKELSFYEKASLWRIFIKRRK